MLKISDYIAMMLSFIGMLLFYLIFTGNLSIGARTSETLEVLEMPENFSVIREGNEENPSCIILYGEQKNSRQTKDIMQMLSNIKMEYAVYGTVEEIPEKQRESVQHFVVTAETFEELGNVESLFDTAKEQGANVIFANLPKESGESNYQEIIGVLENQGDKTIDGIMIFEDMFIQGMTYYDDFKTVVRDVEIDSRCKKLVIEKSESITEQKELIPLIWERRYGNGCFYVVNGDFLTMDAGMGFMTGIFSHTEEDFIYPVINAKVALLDGFPEYENPYENRIQAMYSRSNAMFLRDVVCPSVVKLGETNALVFSTRIYEKVPAGEQENAAYLIEFLENRGYEVDSSGVKPELDIPYVSAGHYHNEEEIFKMQSNISGWGLAAHYLDFSELMGKNAGNPEYEWSAYSLELSKTIKDIYENTDWMDTVTLSQAIERYKRYLVISPEIIRENDSICIRTNNFNTLCFYMVRTDKTILPGNGYDVKQVGDNAYLLEVRAEEIVINFSGQ